MFFRSEFVPVDLTQQYYNYSTLSHWITNYNHAFSRPHELSLSPTKKGRVTWKFDCMEPYKTYSAYGHCKVKHMYMGGFQLVETRIRAFEREGHLLDSQGTPTTKSPPFRAASVPLHRTRAVRSTARARGWHAIFFARRPCPFSSARLASFPADANRFPASVFPWRCSWYNKCGVRTTLLVVFVGFPFPGLGIGERRVCGLVWFLHVLVT